MNTQEVFSKNFSQQPFHSNLSNTTKDRYCYNIWNEVLRKIEDNHHTCCTQKSFFGWSFPKFDRLEEYRLLQNSELIRTEFEVIFAGINMSPASHAYCSSSFQNYSTASSLTMGDFMAFHTSLVCVQCPSFQSVSLFLMQPLEVHLRADCKTRYIESVIT